MSMNDHEITDLVRQMAKPPAPPTYTDADVEELVRMHAGGRHKMRSEAEIRTLDARMLRASGDLDYETCRYEKRALETALHALRKQREKETSTR